VSNELDGEWLEALEVEAPVDDKPADDKPADDVPADDKDPKDDVIDDANSGDDAGGDDDSADAGGDADADEKPKDLPQEEDPTKRAVKEALQEIDEARVSRSSQVEALKREVAETLYPEGIDRQLRDSDGDPITGIDDLTNLINPKTGDLFTEEEAGTWLLSAQQKLNQDIETVEKFIENVAEVNANITENAQRVAAKYGDILSADDKLRERLIQAYDKTLVKDPKTGVTLNAPVDVMEFFDIALESKLADKIVADQAAAEKAKADAAKAAKDGQSDRGDLKPSGKGDNIDPADKEWAQAYKEYEEGK
jgi:hypothetical protein